MPNNNDTGTIELNKYLPTGVA